MRINVVEVRRHDQRGHDSGAVGAAFGAGEQRRARSGGLVVRQTTPSLRRRAKSFRDPGRNRDALRIVIGNADKQKDKGARGGLLRQIDGFGGFGIICLKDFGSVLSMHAETRAETLAALREVYDGAWTRHLGSAGGKTLSWKGKVAIIFAATEVIDSHHSVIGAMGDRFLLSRLKPVAGRKQFSRALKHAGSSISQMRKELAGAVTRLFARRRTEASQIDDEETEAIGKAIALAVRLRGAVARDYRSREIEATTAPKAPRASGSPWNVCSPASKRSAWTEAVQKLAEIMRNPGKSAARSINELSSYTRKDQIVMLPLQRWQQILGKTSCPTRS